MTATLTPSSTTPTARQPGTTRTLWKTGAFAGVAAAVATTAVAVAADAADVSLKVGGESIPVIGFAQLTLIGALVGTILAVVLSHRARRPRRTFVITTVALTALSIVPDGFADAATATKLVLVLTHVVAAAIVIPALASRLRLTR